MSKLTREDVLKLARLSRLKLSDDELEKFAVELGDILDYVKILDQVDVSDLKPTYQVTGLNTVTRPDIPIEYQATPDELLKQAPSIENRQFKVKRIIG